MTVSKDVLILTRAEHKAALEAAFARGVARGRFEERMGTKPMDKKLPPADPHCTTCNGTGWEKVHGAIIRGCTSCYPQLLESRSESSPAPGQKEG